MNQLKTYLLGICLLCTLQPLHAGLFSKTKILLKQSTKITKMCKKQKYETIKGIPIALTLVAGPLMLCEAARKFLIEKK